MDKVVSILNKKPSYLIAFFLLFALNFNILDNLPFGDDYNHIFYHSFFKDSESALSFLNPISPFFKSWGFSYSVLWFLQDIFGEKYFYYRMLNLIIHFGNFLLFKKYLETKEEDKKVELISYLFLFSPIAILTTSWIFQIKTLLSTMFILLALIFYEEKKDKLKSKLISVLFFYVSILSKTAGILLPFYFLIKSLKSIKGKNYYIPISLMLILSIIYGIINIKGITYLARELKNINKPVEAVTADHLILKNELDKLNSTYGKTNDSDLQFFKEISHSVPHYFEPFFNINTLVDKYIIALQNFSKLILSTTGFYVYFPFYENNLSTAKESILYFHVIFATVLIFFICYKKVSCFFLVLFLFLPISGLFYIPYMKYSYSSDHWFYPASFAVLYMMTKVFKSPRFWTCISILILTQYIYNCTKYYNFETLMVDNFKYSKNRFTIEHLTNEKYRLKKNSRYSDIYSYLLSNKDFNNIFYYNQLRFHAKNEQKNGLIRKYFSRFASDQIRSEDQISFQSFLSLHSGIFPTSSLKSIYHLYSVKDPDIVQNNYPYIIEFLNSKN